MLLLKVRWRRLTKCNNDHWYLRLRDFAEFDWLVFTMVILGYFSASACCLFFSSHIAEIHLALKVCFSAETLITKSTFVITLR